MSCAIKLAAPKSAAKFGEQLLAELGMHKEVSGAADHPALAWRRAGMLPLDSSRKNAPKIPPVPLGGAMDGAMLALKSLADHPEKLPLSGSLLLGERARLMSLKPTGRRSSGGHCRLLGTADGRFALNLARDDDWGLLEAWLEAPAASWGDIERVVRLRSATALVERGLELGLPIALDLLTKAKPWFEAVEFQSAANQPKATLVVDLSSLWAGPLAGNLMHLLGAEVIKVESLSRPDGARQGNREFFDLLNAGKKGVALDFASPQDRDDLATLLAKADIVIEASRPRAMRQLGIQAEQLIAQKPGKVWVRLMAYGADQNRVGFGDDIGVGAGLSTIMEKAWGEPGIAGDAIADPISGIYAALAAWTKWQAGGGFLINLSMCDIVRHAMQIDNENWDLPAVAMEWQNMADVDRAELYPMRNFTGTAEDLGASTEEIMSRLC